MPVPVVRETPVGAELVNVETERKAMSAYFWP
jgi:hypothetical protein